ncbi:MAG: efflux RND transporter permease subunit [Candidatus Thiodiazotropha lotti]|nr:efflux RND transporter permease subunit [Candidatus Thiodiazotropha lotti]MCG8004461.1 efflux RND transporter permease subunit [Candidatus Thiodiazotropha lotti]MCG8008981.1 efflux RND transporter permease subunit [Candidatus Thiodiazotropha lotti]MCW4188085.1 efflux RND transporter permease subunit [Candidatus Thiodiazotropha lotti]MCW4196571.1 efflux RND transporter permease subunit [Candidatus Thiodiazotropha lotti]
MISWFARHPNAANLLMAAIMLLGLTALPGLQRETLPEIENDEVEVRVIYKGATAEDVEDAICRRLEDALEGISDLDEMGCEASEGVGVATASMVEGAEMARFLDDVKAEIDAVDDLPEQTEPPIIKELGRTEPVISVAVTGPRDPVALKAYAENLKSQLLTQADLAEVTISGFSDHHIRIEIADWRLRQFGLSAQDIANAVRRHSISTPAGRLESDQEDILIRFDDQRKHADEFFDLPVIASSTGATIRLGDIARITDRFDRDEDKILFNGERGAVLNIAKTRSQDILEVLSTVETFVEQESLQAPQGIVLTLTQDRASVVQDRLNMLVKNGIQGLIMVFLVLWLFFSLRYSFWVTMGLPVSFLGALFVLPLFAVTINMISMVGLLIGIGLLMDDAIVIAENIASRMSKGDKPLHAAITGVKQVLPGIASSFATTLMVFGSLAFISGDIGQILRIMPIVLIIVISVSLLEAFLILPHHLSHSLAHMKSKKLSRFRQGFETRFSSFRDNWFGPLVDRAVDYRYLTLGIVFMMLILSIAVPAGGALKFVGFPDLDGDVLEARILLPQGTPLSRTEEVVEKLTQALQRTNQAFIPSQPDSQPLVSNVTVIYGQNPDAYESGPHVARVVADLLSAEVRDARLDDVVNKWREETGQLTDVISIKYTEPAFGPGGRPIDLRLMGYDLERLKRASNELQAWLNGYQGVNDLSDDLRPGKREFRLHLKPGAGVLGLDAQQVSEQVRTAYQGMKIDEFQIGPESYEVNLRLIASDRVDAEDLYNLSIAGSEGRLIPLSAVAEIEEVRGWARINRVDRQRTVTIQGDVDRTQANAQELLALAQTEFIPGLLERYPDIHFDIQGESKESAKTGQSIGRNVLLGLIGVYMLLALQFKGYMAPLTVMLVIPAALIGVMFGHLALGLDLTMPSMVGMASLFGVVVNDSILLVVFIRQASARGTAVMKAAKDAARARFRPILLTSISTIAGLTPLLLEKSLQAQILIPLAASIAFGLTAATLVALFLVPAVYCILDDFDLLGQADDESEELPIELNETDANLENERSV